MATMLPVYLFTGFLEGGKTHVIQESMEDKRFNSGEKTLILQCEEGIDEFDPSKFYGQNVYARGTAQAKAVIFFLLVAAIGLIQLHATRKKEVQQ